MRKKILIIVVIVIIFILAIILFSTNRVEAQGEITIVADEDLVETGFFEYTMPYFTEDTGWEVNIEPYGKEDILSIGQNEDVDGVFYYNLNTDERILESMPTDRYMIMYDNLILVGPKNPIGYSTSIDFAMTQIASLELLFLSANYDMKISMIEKSIWNSIGLEIEELNNYMSEDISKAELINIAIENNAYTLIKESDWLAIEDKGDLQIVCDDENELKNSYELTSFEKGNQGIKDLGEWLINRKGQSIINDFRKNEYGQPLYKSL